jgi:protein-tyrosine phosphatase
VIDLHCHILPGLDDGPQTIDEALKMAQVAVADGITRTVATPHLAPCATLPFNVIKEVELFNAQLQQRAIALQVYPSYECQHGCELLFNGHGLMPGGKHSLVELPGRLLDNTPLDIFYELLSAGVTPILAHPERNYSFRQDPQLLFELVDHGVLLQLTGGSLLGDFGADVMVFSRFLLQKNKIHFIASDGHSATFRAPLLSKALKVAAKIVGKKQALRLVFDNPLEVLDGGSVV